MGLVPEMIAGDKQWGTCNGERKFISKFKKVGSNVTSYNDTDMAVKNNKVGGVPMLMQWTMGS